MDKNFKTLAQKEQVPKLVLEEFKSLTASSWLAGNVSSLTNFVARGENKKAKELLLKSLDLSSHHKEEFSSNIIEYNDKIVTLDEYVDRVIDFIGVYVSLLKEEQEENEKRAQKLENENFVYHSEVDFPKIENNTTETEDENNQKDKIVLSTQEEIMYINELLSDATFPDSFVQKLNKRKAKLERDFENEKSHISIPVSDKKIDSSLNEAEDETIIETEDSSTPEQVFENLLFKDGIAEVIIHGTNIQKGQPLEDGALLPKLDFDNESAIQILDEVGVKYKKGAKYTWINPEIPIQTNESGRSYYMQDGKKVFLRSGTVVIDVGKGNGFVSLGNKTFMLDHHHKDTKDVTSATEILVNALSKTKKFEKGLPEWLKGFTELVTKIDNLSMDIPEDVDEFLKKYPKTLYAMVPLLRYKNRSILIDLFKKYPNLSLENLTEEELDYQVGYRVLTSVNDHRQGFQGINIVSQIPKDAPLDYVYEPCTLRNIAENQKKFLQKSIESMNYQVQKMYSVSNVFDRSPILGKTIFIDDGGDYDNKFGAAVAYGMGYETMIIHNKKDNSIFVSSKNKAGLKKFAESMEIYTDNGVVVRDSMFVLRNPSFGKDNVQYIKNAIINSAELEDFSLDKIIEEADKMLKAS